MDPGGTMEVAALGRPFSLGMLYDCRKDSLVLGMTLWDHDDLMKHRRDRPQNYNDFQIVASESIEDKSSALNVDASLKASFLSGLVQVGGSAKYLNDNKNSKNQARVTLNYKATTNVQELSLDHLGRVKNPHVFEKGLATHVVTAILYGAQAFFVFDREVSERENHLDVHGNLKMIIKKIPFLAVDGEGFLKLEDEEKEKVEKLSCRFFGDFCLQKTPTTFQDAIQVYQSLPKLLGTRGENTVPVKVWMLPLTSLESSAAKLVRRISLGLVQEAQRVLENFSELEIRCNDALKTTAVQQFPPIGEKLQLFKEMCSEFKMDFQHTLAKKLPSIRGGGEEEAVLAEILKKRISSPFNSKNLKQWMDCKEREIYILVSFTEKMTSTKILPSQSDLYREALSVEHAVCFVFTSLESDEPYLSALSNYLKGTQPEDPQDPNTHDVEKEQWYASKEVMDEMRKKAKLFSDFAEANKENKNIKFVTVGLTDETHKGSTIYLYKDGFTVSENFEPPSKPESVTAADINGNTVTLKISPPRFGAENITSYSVEFCVSGEDGWKQKEGPQAGEVTVSDLRPDTEYVFRCRAVTPLGVGPAFEVRDPIKTSPCSPPGNLQVESNSCEISVNWEKPAELGQDVQISNYILEYTEADGEVKGEDLQWKQMMTTDEKAIVSELQSETEYAVRVRCDCGEAGRSRESISVHVCTTKFTHPAELLRSRCEKIKSGSPSLYKLPLTEEDVNTEGCRRFSFGKESSRQNRTLLLFGATGSGTSTLINGMINYIVGVEWEHSFRFKLVDEDQSRSQAHSQTSEVTVFKINHQEGFRISYSLTIVDTPGFDQCGSVERDMLIPEQLRNLFSQDGITEVDAVCFVVQAALTRLTPSQKYVLASVLSIFGKDVAENIRILVTFADGQQPPVLQAIKASGVPCPATEDGLPVHFRFNNSALFANHEADAAESLRGKESNARNFDRMFWEMGADRMKWFFDNLNLMKTKGLELTKEVLKERKTLDHLLEKIQKLYSGKLGQIKDTSEKLKEHKAEIELNENFEFDVTVTKPVKVDISGTGMFSSNCQQCHTTCHYPCAIPKDDGKNKCDAAGSDGHCTVCPGQCSWNVHRNQGYRWKDKQVKEKLTVKELKEKYQEPRRPKMNVQGLIEKLDAEYESVTDEMEKLAKSFVKYLNRLNEMALNPPSTPECINLLIKEEKHEAKPDWRKRVRFLLKLKEKAEMVAVMERQEQPQ